MLPPDATYFHDPLDDPPARRDHPHLTRTHAQACNLGVSRPGDDQEWRRESRRLAIDELVLVDAGINAMRGKVRRERRGGRPEAEHRAGSGATRWKRNGDGAHASPRAPVRVQPLRPVSSVGGVWDVCSTRRHTEVRGRRPGAGGRSELRPGSGARGSECDDHPARGATRSQSNMPKHSHIDAEHHSGRAKSGGLRRARRPSAPRRTCSVQGPTFVCCDSQ